MNVGDGESGAAVDDVLAGSRSGDGEVQEKVMTMSVAEDREIRPLIRGIRGVMDVLVQNAMATKDRCDHWLPKVLHHSMVNATVRAAATTPEVEAQRVPSVA